MPFNREYERENGGFVQVINRNRTGPPPAPSTGTTVTEDGQVVADSSGVAVSPATPIPVNLPGPRERVIDASGNISPRWYRFFQELYRRTGAYNDNINIASRDLGNASTTAALAFAGAAPTIVISNVTAPTIDSLSLSPTTPTATVV